MADVTTGPTHPVVARTGSRELLVVTFRMGEWDLGVEVTDVRGIYHGLPMIPTPDAPDVVAGDIQISGERIPVLNLARLFGTSQVMNNGNWWIIVLNLLDGPAGLIVDKVTEVVRLDAQTLHVLDDPNHPAREYVAAMARHHQRQIALLDYSILARELLQ